MKKIAVLGCGKVFAKHLKSINILEKKRKLKLVAICDKNKRLIESIKIKNVNKYLDVEEMLRRERIDIISILTPSGFHYKHAIQFAGKVKYVILEKPITLKISDAKKLIQIFKRKKTKIFVVLQNRFNEPIVELKKAIDNNLFGDIFLIFCICFILENTLVGIPNNHWIKSIKCADWFATTPPSNSQVPLHFA